jgi:hypothetical protein
MIVVSASMKKAGSGWYFNLTNDLLVAASNEDVRSIRDRYGLNGLLKGGNCQVDFTHAHLVPRLLLPYLRGQSFTIKTHGRPRRPLQSLIRLGLMKATYIYRDPRDVALSMLDHGRELRAEGNHANVLAGIETLDDALSYIQTSAIDVWSKWMEIDGVLMVRYVDLLTDTAGELRRLSDYLGLDVPQSTLLELTAKYDRRSRDRGHDENLHFNAGIAARYRQKLDSDERRLCRERLDPELTQMGYSEKSDSPSHSPVPLP